MKRGKQKRSRSIHPVEPLGDSACGGASHHKKCKGIGEKFVYRAVRHQESPAFSV